MFMKVVYITIQDIRNRGALLRQKEYLRGRTETMN